MYALLIHGGAGSLPGHVSEDRRSQYKESLGRILNDGFEQLGRGETSLDAVTNAVRMLEDDPLFNAGCGAALTRDGAAELDAAVMDGRTEMAGAVACLKHVRNPVALARHVMEKSPHVFLVGTGAEEFALEQGVELVSNQYFLTEWRRQELQRLQGDKGAGRVSGAQGTVGAVALDRAGNLAAATSTGGAVNKRPGRVGDSPIIGAGVYAKNGVCAVSATGQGEYFIRAVAAHHIATAVEYRGLSLENAAAELIHERLPKLGGQGGIIAVDANGEMVTDFSTEMMFQGARRSDGLCTVGIRQKKS